MRVLVADDSQTERLILSSQLENWGYEFVEASNGQQALDHMLGPNPPRLAILDWRMPEVSGPEVARLIRQQRQQIYIYMILVTGLSAKEDIIKGLQAGADDYITKPIHSEELRVRLRSGARLVEAWTELEQSEKQTRSIIDSASDAILLLAPNGTIQYVNPQAVELCGVLYNAFIGKSFLDFLSNEEDKSQILAALQDLQFSKSRPNTPREMTIVRANGELAIVFLRMVPLHYEGEPAMSIFLTDLTEQKRLEIDLRHAQKMEAVGQLAAGIAHEINTPVQFISDSVTYLQDSWSAMDSLVGEQKKTLTDISPQNIPHRLKEALALAEENADLDFQRIQVPKAFDRAISGLQRVADIVAAMKEFARKDQSKMELADLNQAIESTITVAHNEYRYVADVVLNLGQIPKVNCNLGEINQVLLNLIVNAVHAIEDANLGTSNRGTITVSSAPLEPDRIEIRVQDTGTGISPVAQKRVFEPFYTTKEVGKGSGQGLAITHAIIVDKHKGEVFFETQQGQGTTFVIRLPLNLPS